MSFLRQAPANSGTTHPLAHVRTSRGWSQQRLAELLRRHAHASRINLGTGKNRIWRWENYGTTPDDETQLLLAEVLGVPTQRVTERPWPLWLPAWEDVRFLYPWSPEGSLQALDETSRDAASDRREFLGLTGLALSAIAHDWQGVQPGRVPGQRKEVRAGQEVADRVAERTHHLRRMDDHLGGGAIRLLVIEELRLVTALLHERSYSAWVNRDLFTAAAGLAQLAGWASFDAGFHGAAQRYYIAALHAAHTGHDRPLGAYILTCMSEQLTHAGHPHAGVTLVRAGLESIRNTAPPASVAAVARFQLASAHAAADDVRPCARAAEAAARDAAMIDQRVPTAEPAWLYWLDAPHLDAMEGHCLAKLDRPGEAVDYLERAIRSELPTFVRDRAIHLTWLADAHLTCGEREKACAAANRARELASLVHSEYGQDCVRSIERRLSSQ